MKKKIIPILSMLVLSLGFILPAEAIELTSYRSIEGDENRGSMSPNEQVDWRFWFKKEDGSVHKMFMPMHEKLMHMIVVKSDLSEFSHVHPSYDQESGEFSIRANEVQDDPDNFMASQMVVSSGDYFLFTEVMPMPEDERNPMKMDRFLVRSEGAEKSKKNKNELSFFKNKNIKYYDETGAEVRGGGRYKVVFTYQNFDWCDRWLPKFYFYIYEKIDGEYTPAEGFQKWLSMGGHSILISHEGEHLQDKVFHHLHGFLPIAQPGKFTFPYDHHKPQLPGGKYKIWGQFKHDDQVRTFSFDFDYHYPEIKVKRAKSC